MNKDRSGENIPAFPVSEDMFIGTASDEACANRVVHFTADGTCTFKFKGGATKAVVGAKGFDVITSSNCESVTSTAAIMIG